MTSFISRKSGFSLLSSCCLLSLFANPENGIVIEGNASFDRKASEFVIHADDRSIIHWDSFSIDAHETTRFIQGSRDAAVLNRVTGDQISQILGSLIADGKVFLVNQNGVIVGKEGVIDVGSFIASSLDISNTAFRSGEEFVFDESSLLPVANSAEIRALNGDILVMVSQDHRILACVQGKKSLYVEVSENGSPLISHDNIYSLGVQDQARADALQIEKNGNEVFLRRSEVIDPNPSSEPLLWKAIGNARADQQERMDLYDPSAIQLAACPPVPTQLIDPNPTGANSGFGDVMVPLPSGNLVVTKPNDDFVTTGAGAVYLYDGTTGALISTLTGSSMNDHVGNSTPSVLTNGNYVIMSPFWANNGVAHAGAATWASGVTGVSGSVSSANSLVGTQLNDFVANGVTAILSNGNYVVTSINWNNGAVANVGASTWCNGLGGTVGDVSPTNSLVGSTVNDSIGINGTTSLTNGHYVVRSSNWSNVAFGSGTAGAATWGNGNGGTVGEVSITNSFVGMQVNDKVSQSSLIALTNGNYVISSTNWQNFASLSLNAGAVTWGNGSSGSAGLVSVTNSLIGQSTEDQVGLVLVGLSNGNYAVGSPLWANPLFGTGSAGAATWGDGAGGTTTGLVTVANSLVGTSALDRVGIDIIKLTNGNYVVDSQAYINDGVLDAGAATWVDGSTGLPVGNVNASNSLVGGSTADSVGINIVALANGHYVVGSTGWNNQAFGGASGAGAATWGNGITGAPRGLVTTGNSLVGTQPNDFIGQKIFPLANGNYVVASHLWQNVQFGSSSAGAAAWGDGSLGTTVGPVSSINSLIGTQPGDGIGSDVLVLTNGNYVVISPSWNDVARGASSVGAATWGNGLGGTVGVVSPTNSLVGTTTNDSIGNKGVSLALTNGNYVIATPRWHYLGLASAGASTWGNGLTGIVGPINVTNSIVGTQSSDKVGTLNVNISVDSYAVLSDSWSNGGNPSAGAVTIASSTDGSYCDGTYGPITASNSLVGPDLFPASMGAQLSNNVIVTSPSGASQIAVEFKNYFEVNPLSNGFQSRIFNLAGLPAPTPPTPPTPTPTPSAGAPFAAGIHDFAIAITEFFSLSEEEAGWLTLKDILAASDIYPPLGTYKGLQQEYPSLIYIQTTELIDE